MRFLSEFANEVVGLSVKKGTRKRRREICKIYIRIFIHLTFFPFRNGGNVNIKIKKKKKKKKNENKKVRALYMNKCPPACGARLSSLVLSLNL